MSSHTKLEEVTLYYTEGKSCTILEVVKLTLC